MDDLPWLYAWHDKETVAAGFPLQQLVRLCLEKHKGKQLLIATVAGLVVAVIRADGAVRSMAVPTPVAELHLDDWLAAAAPEKKSA